MDSAWIKVFILTISECVAPAGKTVCQQQEFHLQFLTQSDCQAALQQLVTLKDAAKDVIVDHDASGCAPSAREANTFESLAAIDKAYKDEPGWRPPNEEASAAPGPSERTEAFRERLDKLKSCDDTHWVAPCKNDGIIVESTSGEPVEVWHRDE
jgi:hypothetical protein